MASWNASIALLKRMLCGPRRRFAWRCPTDRRRLYPPLQRSPSTQLHWLRQAEGQARRPRPGNRQRTGSQTRRSPPATGAQAQAATRAGRSRFTLDSMMRRCFNLPNSKQDRALRKRNPSGFGWRVEKSTSTGDHRPCNLALQMESAHLNLLQCEKLRGFGGRAPNLPQHPKTTRLVRLETPQVL